MPGLPSSLGPRHGRPASAALPGRDAGQCQVGRGAGSRIRSQAGRRHVMVATMNRRRATSQIPEVGVYRTPRHLYYFNGQGPWPGVTTVTDVLDKPALVKWKREQVALAA